MSNDDSTKKALEAIADAAETMAKEHEHGTSGGCVIGQIASGLGAAARRRAASCASGPAQVATERYRTTWEQTFGGRKAVRGEA